MRISLDLHSANPTSIPWTSYRVLPLISREQLAKYLNSGIIGYSNNAHHRIYYTHQDKTITSVTTHRRCVVLSNEMKKAYS